MEERTKKSQKDPDAPIKWVKKGGGSFLLRAGDGKVKRRIKSGEVFTARPSEISKAFRDVVTPVRAEDLVEGELMEEEVEVVQPQFKPVHKGGGRYIVVDGEGKQVNEGYLEGKMAAERLIADLAK